MTPEQLRRHAARVRAEFPSSKAANSTNWQRVLRRSKNNSGGCGSSLARGRRHQVSSQKKIFLPKKALILAQRQQSQYRNSRDFVVDVADLHLLQTKTCGSESMLVSAGSGGVNV